MKPILLTFLIAVLFSVSTCLAQVKIIFDTDIGGDADDLGALAMLHNLHNRGECKLLAIASWTTEQNVIPALDAINRYYKNPTIPLGIRLKDSHQEQYNYCKPIADKLPSKLTNQDVMLATELYRKVLSKQDDKSVTIVVVGPLKNIMDLLQSPADNYSPLSGKELIEQKVKKFVIMGGHFPEGKNEWNFNGNMPGVTRYVLENLMVPIVFSGFEIGAQIKTGSAINEIDPNSPLYLGWMCFSENASWMKQYFKGKILSNASYDETAVLYAVRGGLGKYWDKVDGGRCVAKENGDNSWVSGEVTNHSYLVLKQSPEEMAQLIESIMLNKF